MTADDHQPDIHPDRALDARLAAMDREIPLRRDLWPGIAAELRSESTAPAARRRWWPAAIAAGIALVSVSLWLQRPRPASPPIADQSGFQQVRAELQPGFAASLADLEPATRALVLKNLKIIRDAEAEIAAALASDPSNPLLLELRQRAHDHEIDLMTGLPPADPVPPRRSEI